MVVYMERSSSFFGKSTISTGPCSISELLVYQRVDYRRQGAPKISPPKHLISMVGLTPPVLFGNSPNMLDRRRIPCLEGAVGVKI